MKGNAIELIGTFMKLDKYHAMVNTRLCLQSHFRKNKKRIIQGLREKKWTDTYQMFPDVL